MGIISIWLTFYILDREFFKDSDFQSLIWPGIYSFTLAIGTFLFKFSQRNNSKASVDNEI